MESWKKVMGGLAAVIMILLVAIIDSMLRPQMQSRIIDEQIIANQPVIAEERIPQRIIEDNATNLFPVEVSNVSSNKSLFVTEKEIIIDIYRTRLSQPNITLSEGTRVVWINQDDRVHEISGRGEDIFRNGSMRVVKRLLPGQNFTWTFEQPGEYPYIDGVYGMHGTIYIK